MQKGLTALSVSKSFESFLLILVEPFAKFVEAFSRSPLKTIRSSLHHNANLLKIVMETRNTVYLNMNIIIMRKNYRLPINEIIILLVLSILFFKRLNCHKIIHAFFFHCYFNTGKLDICRLTILIFVVLKNFSVFV